MTFLLTFDGSICLLLFLSPAFSFRAIFLAWTTIILVSLEDNGFTGGGGGGGAGGAGGSGAGGASGGGAGGAGRGGSCSVVVKKTTKFYV